MMMIANDFLCNKVMFAQSSESPPNNNSNNMMIRAGARNVIMASTVSSKGLIFALLWLVIHWIFERLLLLIIFSFLFLQGVLHMGSLRGISFGSRMIKEREEEETCICAPVVIGKKIYKYLLKVGIRIQRMIEFFFNSHSFIL